MADINSGIDILEDLIETCLDGENGFKRAAEKINDPEIRSFFLAQSTERARFARELEEQVKRFGEPERTGSAARAIHRTWIGLKEALGGRTRVVSGRFSGERRQRVIDRRIGGKHGTEFFHGSTSGILHGS